LADELAQQQVITQIGIVVRDVEAKARAWSETFGLPMPEIRMTGPYEDTHAEYRGAPTQARAKLAFFRFENITIELIEPVGEPSTWAEQLERHGDSIHHIAFSLGGVERMMAKLPALEGAGLTLVQRGDWQPNGRYLYLDGVDRLGAILEMLP
jgi:catechol 2,3-dioxygenase-like lactoylglutathione lyase family enzyme